MKKLLKVGVIVLVVIVVFSAVFDNKGKTNSTVKKSFSDGFKAGTQKTDVKKYQELSRKDGGVVENIGTLIDPGTDNVELIANEIKKTCKKQCNISIYDDKKAYDLDEEYNKLISSQATPSKLSQWKENNYVFVADHLVGYMEFADGVYTSYPYRDFVYKEMKAKSN